MKTYIDVANRKEAVLLRRGLEQEDVRAMVLVMGALAVLPTDRARARALRFVSDMLTDMDLKPAQNENISS